MPVNKPMPPHLGELSRKLFLTLAGILLAYLIVLVGTLIRNNLVKYNTLGYQPKQERTLFVSGEDRVMATPDVAVVRMGQTINAPTVADAQRQNTNVMNALIEKLKAIGINAADIQTSDYRVEQNYVVQNEEKKLDGYTISQTITVRIRDVSRTSAVLALVDELGLNTVGGLEYVIDEPDAYQKKAREKAIQKAKLQAKELARSLNVSLGKVISYSEYAVSGKGGDMGVYASDPNRQLSMPSVEPGSEEIAVHVNITFEIF